MFAHGDGGVDDDHESALPLSDTDIYAVPDDPFARKCAQLVDEANLTPRQRLGAWLAGRQVPRINDSLLLLAALFSLATYIYSDYHSGLKAQGPHHFHPPFVARFANWLLVGAATLDLVVFFSLTRRGVRLALRSSRIWTAVAVFLPVLLLQVLPASTPLALLRFLFACMSLRVLYLYRFLHFITEPIMRQVVQIGITLLVLLFVSSSAVGQSDNLAWGSAMYFMVITLATVGYGDITPSNNLTRVLVCLALMLAFVLVPIQATVLGTLVGARHSYDGRMGKRLKGSHVVVLGKIAASRLVELMDEFFHSDRGSVGTSFAVAALQPNEPPAELIRLQLGHTRGRFRVFRGHPSRDADLDRVQTRDARAVFVVSPDPPMTPIAADKDAVIRALAVRRLAPAVPLIVQLVLPTYRSYLAGLDIEVVCEQELSAGLLARSVRCPGVTALLSGLLDTSRAECDRQPAGERRAVMPWLREFASGDAHELYNCFLAGQFAGWRFAQLAQHLHREFGVLLIGIESRSPRVLALQPGAQYLLRGDEVVFLIAADKRVVNRAFPHGPVDAEGLPSSKRQPEAGARVPPTLALTLPPPDPPAEHAKEEFRSRHHLGEPGRLEVLAEAPAELRGHVVLCVCGTADRHLYDLLAGLRSRLEPLQPLVMLCSGMAKSVWRRLGVFPQLYVVRGSGLRCSDLLHRARAAQAAHVLVLSMRPPSADDPNQSFITDSAAVLTTRNLLTNVLPLNPALRLTTYLYDMTKSPMCVSYTQLFTERTSPHWAAGYVLNGRLADRVAAQCFFNPYVPSIVRQLLHHNFERGAWGVTNLVQEPVPPQLVGRSFGELLQHLLETADALPIGLYRPAGDEAGAIFPYVFTNPPAYARLRAGDRVFLLRHRSESEALHAQAVQQL